MSDSSHDLLRRLFDRAFELPPAARAVFLEQKCRGDEALKKRLEAMLAAAEGSGFLGEPTGAGAAAAAVAAVAPAENAVIGEGPGTVIGPYRLLRQLGEGGFGFVFLAEQSEPVQRQVALKILKPGMDTRQVVSRFEQERQALALMDHPNIARVLDAGATEAGRPFFVMDFVDGVPITAHCDRQRVAIDDRLRLFAQVCDAVQHAHGKGIIHRDLKPSNVLVAMQDGEPHVKVIDFGIAKAIAREPDMTALTELQAVIGTLQYMSPEQAAGSADIDTRSDVYALGVLLYELLTGSTPVDTKTVAGGMFGEVKRLICEVDPPRPSTRLSESQEVLPSLAAQRRLEPKRLGSRVRGELDWIVMKALEKERQRRYGTASELAQDIRRHLHGEPVVAAPPSASYRIRKFVRRHRGLVAAAGAVVLSLLAGVIAFSWQARVAEAERQDAVVARHEAEAQRRLADERATQLAQVADFQQSMLAQIDASAAGARLLRDLRGRHREALAAGERTEQQRTELVASFHRELSRVNGTDAAAKMIEATLLEPAVVAIGARFADQPLVAATLRQTLALSYDKLGRYEKALVLQQEALATRERLLGSDHLDTARSRSDLAVILEHLGRFAESEPLLRQALATRLLQLGPEHADTLLTQANLGGNLRYQSKLAEAETLLVDVLEQSRRVLGAESRATLVRCNLLAYLRIDQGRLADAEPLWREAYEVGTRVFGADDPDVIIWTNNFGGLCSSLGRPKDAERYYHEALAASLRVHGAEHPFSWNMQRNIAHVLIQQGRFAEAEVIQRDVLERRRQALGDEHPDTISSLQGLGIALRQLGRFDEAGPLLEQAYGTMRRLRGQRDLETLNLGVAYASFLMAAGRLDAAEALYRELLAAGEGVWGPEHSDRLIVLNNLGNTLLRQKRSKEAEPMLRELLATRRRVSGESHPETLVAQSCFARAREDQGALDEAEELYRDATAKFVARLGERHPNTLSSRGNLAFLLLARERFADAEVGMRELVGLYTEVAGVGHAQTATARRGLGRALLGQKRFAEAREELLAAESITAALPGVDPERRAVCCDALVRLFEAWHEAEPTAGHEAAAEVWRARAAELRGR
jgi:eukaryotic-like serine/threonine-protein kinase